ncbi:hypothetical protein MH928_02725 [Flavobacterium sp. WW92]|uniref:hypothetical protein n=1 Tax=unclassified Flavobacterium TaxID=196869 RepID=UPI002225044D|nr:MULTISPECIES: hypothetical protein [unclassified Flavobacterium]WDO13624.1 hypothetical protein MH928_02725 [Flavobacterium sp. WW92]
MKNSILYLLLIVSLNVFSQNRYETDSITAYSLIEKEMTNLKKIGIAETNVLSLFDDTGKIIILWKEKEKYRAVKMYYKGKECNKVKRQRLSKLDKKNIELILKNPQILSKISNSNCNDRAYSFNKVNISTENFSDSFFSHCEQVNELIPLTSLYFSLR